MKNYNVFMKNQNYFMCSNVSTVKEKYSRKGNLRTHIQTIHEEYSKHVMNVNIWQKGKQV